MEAVIRSNLMDLDTDPLYLGGDGTSGGIGGGVGGRSLASYTTSRDRLTYDRYGALDGRGYGASSAFSAASSSLNPLGQAPISSTTRSLLYRPSTLSGQLDAITSKVSLAPYSSVASTTTTTTTAAAAATNSAALDRLISSSSYLHRDGLSSGPKREHSIYSQSYQASADLLGSGSLSYLPISTAAAASTSSFSASNNPLFTIAAATTAVSTGTTSITTTTAAQTTAANQHHQVYTNPSRVQSSLAGGGLNSHNNLLQQMFDDMRQIEDTVDSIEIPARGRCKVLMAKYGYDPFKQSPNDNPDAELAFNAGDYIMVFDDVDEDGYFIGELMDGRRGYVPSNWLDRLTGEDLFEFQASVLYKQPTGKDDELDSNSYPPEFYDAIVSETMNHSNFQHILAPEDYHRMNDYVDLDDVNEVDDECLSDYERAEAEQMRRAVPPPQRLVLERQLNKSILIGWLHPQAAKGTIVSYQVYVDGVLKSTVPSGDRTKALLEGVDSSIPHRISVRAIDLHARHSNDAGCTIVIGQKIPFAPSCVKASHITSDSALISWLPCNSNFHHVVAVNSVEVQTVRPGVYKHLINGLSANTLYRVWVRAKPGKILSIDEKNPKKLESLTTYVDFKTMPKSLPDPPVNVQVEAGPQRRTLLVTWLPLTLNDFGSSNGCAVTGYAVFAGHKKLADIDSPTGDHALLDLADLESLHKKSVTVRTKSGENLSQDSMPCQIPDEYLKAAAVKTDNNQQAIGANQHGLRYQSAGLHQQRLSDSSLMGANSGHSPLRHYNASRYADHHHKQLQQQQLQSHAKGGSNSRYSIMRGRQLARSMQNLESDLDSRRSSIPAIEITRETSGSDHGFNNQAESYSEEEFESSMRFRGMRGKPGSRMNARYRARQSHSVDSSVPHLNQQTRAYQQQHHHQLNNFAKSRAGQHQLFDSRDIRYFVALFDYDPSTMSPNPNAASEELAFKEGSIIKIIGDKGPDGFYRGEFENHVGYVPCNVVSEITDQNLLISLQQENQQQNNSNFHHRQMIQQLQQQQQQQKAGNLQQATGYLSQQQQQQQQRTSNQQQQMDVGQHQHQQQQASGVKRMTALYDYDPQENSPNADTESEIPFKVGDIIYVYGKMDTDGFYMGEVERTKQRGLVPSNFLREDPQQPVGLKQPGGSINQQQQKQQSMFGPNQMVGPMDALQQQQQQQRPPPNAPGQFMNQVAGTGGAVQAQQIQVNRMGDPSLGGAYGAGPQVQANQTQQMNKMNNAQQLQQRGNVRGSLPMQNQPLIQSQQNINRPTSLSLGGLNANPQSSGPSQFNDWNNQRNQMMQVGGQNQMQQTVQQQQQQQQQQQLLLQNNNSNLVGSGGGMMNLQQQYGANMIQGQQQFHQQQQASMMNNQQPGGGGVLSNLLSSGKQIIGAATTPRAPNQPNQFPSMMGAGGMGLAPATGLAEGGNFPALQRPGSNLMQTNFPNEPGSHQIGHNSFALAGNQMQQQQPMQQQVPLQQQQQQQQQHYNQMATGMARGPMNQMTGEEQGGNILNTVKNMFKL